jgi:hypothetical protein
MIVHHSKTSNARQTLSYVLDKEGAEFLFTNMGASSDPIQLANEMQKSWSTNKRIKYPVYHASLSLHGKSNEYFDSITWCRVAQFFLNEMGYSSVPYVVVRHTDTSNDHVHIVAGRCDLRTNKCVKDNWDHIKARQIAKTLEQKYELTPTPDSWSKGRTEKSNTILDELKDQLGKDYTLQGLSKRKKKRLVLEDNELQQL